MSSSTNIPMFQEPDKKEASKRYIEIQGNPWARDLYEILFILGPLTSRDLDSVDSRLKGHYIVAMAKLKELGVASEREFKMAGEKMILYHISGEGAEIWCMFNPPGYRGSPHIRNEETLSQLFPTFIPYRQPTSQTS